MPPPAPLELRLLIDEVPRSGSVNMAVDEWLLIQAASSGHAALRFYTWDVPTLTLGYFQRTLPDGPLATLPAFRRLTGGGAILHDQELTYSLTLPPHHPLSRNPIDIYRLVHAAAITALATFASAVAFRGLPDPAADSSFLCFGRGDPLDVLHGKHKVLGSAQRRRKGAILQHGSLLLARSRWSPDFPGLRDLGTHPLPLEDVRQAWQVALIDELQPLARVSRLEFDEFEVGQIAEAHYPNLNSSAFAH